MNTQDTKNLCSSCGKEGHFYRSCTLPITSYGIILINIDYDKDKIDDIFANMKGGSPMDISIENTTDINMFIRAQDMIKYLMICRRHTIGYTEFIRGKYKEPKMQNIEHVFKQMTRKEIENINNNINNFDYLWNTYWNGQNNEDKTHSREYAKAKEKYSILLNDKIIENCIKTITPIWQCPEWGFPKGRRNHDEHDITCAIREFEEETGLTSQDYKLLLDIKPFIEDFKGTDSKKYRHVYYVAFATSNKTPTLNTDNDTQSCEIGDIGYFTYKQSAGMIRPYQTERLSIMTDLFKYVANIIISSYKK